MQASPSDTEKLIARSGADRRRLITALREFALNEGEAAEHYENMAASTPGRRAEYQAAAEDARKEARAVRDILRAMSSSADG
jgi:hypothetical protein